jgi:hypothetical protein
MYFVSHSVLATGRLRNSFDISAAHTDIQALPLAGPKRSEGVAVVLLLMDVIESGVAAVVGDPPSQKAVSYARTFICSQAFVYTPPSVRR